MVSKRPERPKCQMKITPRTSLYRGHRAGDERAKGEDPTHWTVPDGHLPPTGWHQVCLGGRSQQISWDCVNSLSMGKGTQGPTGGQTALKKPHRPWLKEAVPCTDVIVNLPGPKGHRFVGVGTHSPRPMSESGGSNPGSTTNLWVTPGKVHPLSGPQFPCI